MPDHASLQDLEDMERAVQHMIDLLNQADQDLRQCHVAFDNFAQRHPDNAGHGNAVADAVRSIEGLLHSYNDANNQFIALINEARTAAQAREIPDNPY